MKLLLVRHGETEENTKDLIQGQSVQGNLNEKGVKQAKKISDSLRDFKIDFIYSSDLKRALESSKIILKNHPESLFKLMKQVRERNFGDFEGKTEEEVDFENIKMRYQKGFEAPPRGEGLREFYKRVRGFFEFLKTKHSNDCVLIVSHKNFIRTLIGIVNGKKPEEVWDFGRISNEKFYEFEI